MVSTGGTWIGPLLARMTRCCLCGNKAATASWAREDFESFDYRTKGKNRPPSGYEMNCGGCATFRGVKPGMLCVGCSLQLKRHLSSTQCVYLPSNGTKCDSLDLSQWQTQTQWNRKKSDLDPLVELSNRI